MLSSKITTIFGVIAACGPVAAQFGYVEIGNILTTVGLIGMGGAARDNNKSSRSLGVE